MKKIPEGDDESGFVIFLRMASESPSLLRFAILRLVAIGRRYRNIGVFGTIDHRSGLTECIWSDHRETKLHIVSNISGVA